MPEKPPRDELVRARHGGYHLRQEGDHPPTMFGYLARFDEWTEINSDFEGHFMERIAPGAFKKTIAENAGRMRALFQHGQDPQIGDKPLGKIDVLEEDRQGAYYEVPLLDAPYVRDNILPGLRAGLYGASFRFSAVREKYERDTNPSDYNPTGLPERTLTELALKEFGPVTFPAYTGATAAVRSLTDQVLKRRLGVETEEPPDDEEPEDETAATDGRNAPPEPDAAPAGTSVRDAAQPYTWLDVLGREVKKEEVRKLWIPHH